HNTPQTARPRYSHPHATQPTTPHLTRGKGQAKPLLNRRSERVLPADAGVFRRACWTRSLRARPPRRRGGVPRPACGRPRSRGSSPPTRGCSVQVAVGLVGGRVLPADAGVFQRAGTGGATDPRPPRRRGGVPTIGIDVDAATASSPPTRGCSEPAVGRSSGSSVLPADAGVFRDSEKPMVTALGPPRRRGGVPLAGLTPRELPKSSPQTRGCSVGSLLRETDFKLLHAVGGVVRLYQLSRRAHQ